MRKNSLATVELRNAVKRFGDVTVIHGVELQLNSGEFIVFVGPSGCGKSTLLRLVAGLEELSSGSIHIGGRDVTHEAAVDRGIAMVFQSYALYPHMTVAENMGFGLKMNGVDKKEVANKVEKAAKTLQLDQLLKRKPKNLSGGQRQRVAIGRAIVRDPDVFLFDEPLSNLVNAAEGVVGSNVTLGMRPEDLGDSSGDATLPMNVEVAERLGGSTYLYGNCCGLENFVVQRPGLDVTKPGQSVDVRVNVGNCHLFDQHDLAFPRLTDAGQMPA